MKRLITVLRDGDKGGALWSAHTLAGLLDRLHGAIIVIVQFVDTYDSKLGKILDAGQGQFTITDRDGNTPYIKKLRVVSTVTYSLKD